MTGRPALRASTTVTSMKLTLHQRPNELPLGSAITRTLLKGMPSASWMPSRSSDGVCEEVQTVTLSPSHSAMQALRPIEAYCWLSYVMSHSAMISASARPCAVSPQATT